MHYSVYSWLGVRHARDRIPPDDYFTQCGPSLSGYLLRYLSMAAQGHTSDMRHVLTGV
jgi:hypothetical protein